MNRLAAACAASSLPALHTRPFGGSSTIDPDTSTTSITSSGVARPVHGVPIAVAPLDVDRVSVIDGRRDGRGTTTVSSPIAVPE